MLESTAAVLVSIAKTAFKKIGALIRSVKFLSLEVALYAHVWNTVARLGWCP